MKFFLSNGTSIFEKENVMKQCNICKRDFHESNVTNQLKTAGGLFKSFETKFCDICRLNAEPIEFENHLLIDSHNLIQKMH